MTMNDASTQKSDCICKYSQISFSPNCKETRSVILISKETRPVVLICKGSARRSTGIICKYKEKGIICIGFIVYNTILL